jgi:hypothetical protein
MSCYTCFDWFKKLRLFSYVLNLKTDVVLKASRGFWNFSEGDVFFVLFFILKAHNKSKHKAKHYNHKHAIPDAD